MEKLNKKPIFDIVLPGTVYIFVACLDLSVE